MEIDLENLAGMDLSASTSSLKNKQDPPLAAALLSGSGSLTNGAMYGNDVCLSDANPIAEDCALPNFMSEDDEELNSFLEVDKIPESLDELDQEHSIDCKLDFEYILEGLETRMEEPDPIAHADCDGQTSHEMKTRSKSGKMDESGASSMKATSSRAALAAERGRSRYQVTESKPTEDAIVLKITRGKKGRKTSVQTGATGRGRRGGRPATGLNKLESKLMNVGPVRRVLSRQVVPEEEKDSDYYEHRRKNTESARRCRENKRAIDIKRVEIIKEQATKIEELKRALEIANHDIQLYRNLLVAQQQHLVPASTTRRRARK